MYAIMVRVEVDATLPEQAETVRRKIASTMKTAFEKAPYLIKFAVTPAKELSPLVDPSRGGLILKP